MPLETSCIKCHRPLRAKSSLAGKVVRCPRCSWEVQLPSEDAAGAPPLRATSRPRAALPPRESRLDEELSSVPTLRRQKFRARRLWGSGWHKRRFLNLPLRWWATVLALVLVICWAVDQVRNGGRKRPLPQPATARQDLSSTRSVATRPTDDSRRRGSGNSTAGRTRTSDTGGDTSAGSDACSRRRGCGRCDACDTSASRRCHRVSCNRSARVCWEDASRRTVLEE